MYKFVIKSITGSIIHTSVRTFVQASDAQFEGSKFMNISRLMGSRLSITSKSNYVDVISV